MSTLTCPAPHLQGRGCRFTIIPPAGHKHTLKDGTEKVYTGKNPQGKNWAGDGGSNYSEKDIRLEKNIGRGWNHGLVCGTGGVIVFDGDNSERLQELGVLQKIPPTVQVESRPGHRHHHLLCPELKKKFVFYDPILTEEKDGKVQRLHLGEVLGPGGHAVLPGSTHPSGTKYHIVEGCPQEMADITLDQLKEIVSGLEFTSDPNRHISFEEATGTGTSHKAKTENASKKGKTPRKSRKTATTSLSDQLDVTAVLAAYSWTPKRSEGDQAKGEPPGHSSESGDCFQINLQTGQWHCKQCEAGGDLASLVAVMAGIIPCTGHADLKNKAVFAEVLAECEEQGWIAKKIELHPIEALRLILADCDGAVRNDGVGLSKRDAEDLTDIIKRIEDGETNFSKEEHWTVYNKMKKYRNTQLSGYTLIKPSKKGEDSDSMATIMVELAIKSGASFWQTPEAEGFITMQVNTHFEHHPLKSSRVKDFLSELLYGHDGRAATRNGITDAVNTLSARARFEGEVHEVFTRVAGHHHKIFIDLGDADWRAVEISAEGWRIIPSGEIPVKFRRAKGTLPLPSPITGGTLDDLRRVLNVPVGSPWTLLRSWILQALRPKGPYPVLIVDGEQGSGKSWLGRILRHVIDPNSAPLRRPPRNDHELMIAATNAHILAFDNLSTIPPWLADAFCVVSTGGGMSVRRLYTDDEEEIFNVQRPIILNSIAELTTRGDLLDRAITLHLPRITDEKRKSEEEIFAELDRIGPGVLGAICDTLSGGLRAFPHVKLASLPRMADFAKWATACEIAIGRSQGEFIDAFNENQDKAKAELIENDTFSAALVALVNAAPAGELEITSTLLLTTLESRCNVMSNRDRPDGWPRSGKGVRGKIRRIAPGLRAVGIDVSEGRTKRERSLIFRRRT
jgi:hypothetical protein